MRKKSLVAQGGRVIFFALLSAALLTCAMLIGCTKPNDDTKKEPFDPLENSFTVWTEDWTAVGGTIAVVDKTLAVRGGEAKAQKTWTLPDKADLWVDFDYLPDGKDVALKVEVEIGGVKKLMADALPVYADFGRLNYQIPFSMYYTQAEYGGKEAKLNLTAIGASESQGVRLDNVRTYTRGIAGTVDQNDTPLRDTFSESLEDWYIGGHYSSMDHCYQQAPAVVKHDYDKIFIEGSQLKTAPNFNRDIHTSLSKFFALPTDADQKQYQMNLSVRASDKGTMVMALCIVDGKVIDVTDGWMYIHSQEESVLSCAIPKGGKKAQVIFMQRDSAKNGGHGEYCFIKEFSVSEYAVDPYDNRFIVDLQDWVDLGEGSGSAIGVSGGYAHLSSGAAMIKTALFPALTENWRQSIRLFYASKGSIRVTLSLIVDGKTTVLLDESSENALLKEVAMHEFDYAFGAPLAGKQGIFVLRAASADPTADLKIKTFSLTKKWQVDPLNNTFQDGIEDWYKVSAQGHEVNGIKFDANWNRIYFEYLGSGDVAGQTVLGKDYTLPDSARLQISARLEGSSAGGQQYAGYYTLQLIVDGAAYTVAEKTRLSVPSHVVAWRLDEIPALQGVSYAGKKVSVRLILDENKADQQMMAIMDDFKTEIYA